MPWGRKIIVKVRKPILDLDAVEGDIKDILKALYRYGIIDRGENNEFAFDSTHTLKDITSMRGKLNKRARKNPDKLILIVFALASHGM